LWIFSNFLVKHYTFTGLVDVTPVLNPEKNFPARAALKGEFCGIEMDVIEIINLIFRKQSTYFLNISAILTLLPRSRCRGERPAVVFTGDHQKCGKPRCCRPLTPI
jgi:hypothetical protein